MSLAAVLTLIGLIGHAELAVLFWNRVEARALPDRVGRALLVLGMSCAIVVPLGVLLAGGPNPLDGLWTGQSTSWLARIAALYLLACAAFAVVATSAVIAGRFRVARNSPLKHHKSVQHETIGNAEAPGATWSANLLLNVPGNQSLQIEQNEKHVEIPGLPAELDRLTIAHLSDLHLTGRIGRKFFEKVVELTNEMDADLVAVTGDLVDEDELICWLPSILGRLRARDGIYYVLGNHDLKTNVHRLRLALGEAGLVNLGGGRAVVRRETGTILLAGDERPWFSTAPDLSAWPSKDDSQLRLLLAHTPDRLPFALEHDVDLLLAGHTHGGQIRVPGIGAILCPCRGPLAHAAGAIRVGQTAMHVSRGISAEHPIRINCRPEVTRLVLTCPVESRPTTSDRDQWSAGERERRRGQQA